MSPEPQPAGAADPAGAAAPVISSRRPSPVAGLVGVAVRETTDVAGAAAPPAAHLGLDPQPAASGGPATVSTAPPGFTGDAERVPLQRRPGTRRRMDMSTTRQSQRVRFTAISRATGL